MTLVLKTALKCIEMTPKIAQFVIAPQNISTISSYPPIKKIHFLFVKTQKVFKFQVLNPPKMVRAYV